MKDGSLVVASVLSGNRNFEGRINPQVRANYLASPPLVVAYAIAGTMDMDLTTEPLGNDSNGKPVYLKDVWPTQKEVQDAINSTIRAEMFQKAYEESLQGDERWKALEAPAGELFQWDETSTYVKRPPFFDDMPKQAPPLKDIRGARVLAVLGDSVTTDHISPAGSIQADSPAGKYLQSHGVSPKDFNSYGARRGNHEVMMRGTFANVRLRNLMLPGTEGGLAVHLPEKTSTTIYDAAMQYQQRRRPADDPCRKGIWLRIVARLGGKGTVPAGHPGGARGKLTNASTAATWSGWASCRCSSFRGESAETLGLTGFETFDIPASRRGLNRANADAPRTRRQRGKTRTIESHLPDRHALRNSVLPAWRNPAVRAQAAVGVREADHWVSRNGQTDDPLTN